jgi:hypothetical protein
MYCHIYLKREPRTSESNIPGMVSLDGLVYETVVGYWLPGIKPSITKMDDDGYFTELPAGFCVCPDGYFSDDDDARAEITYLNGGIPMSENTALYVIDLIKRIEER